VKVRARAELGFQEVQRLALEAGIDLDLHALGMQRDDAARRVELEVEAWRAQAAAHRHSRFVAEKFVEQAARVRHVDGL
jgi:hypothetical protein